MGYSKGSTTRASIVEGAAQLVLARGFSGTLVDDVCAHLGITRGRLTHHFRTREQLIDAVQEYAFTFFRATVVAPLSDPSLTPRKRIKASFTAMRRVYLELSGDVRGCFIGHSAMETATRSPEMALRLEEILEDWRGGFAATLKAGGATKARSDEAALIALATIEGAVLLARARPDDTKLRSTFGALERMLLEKMRDSA